MDYARNRYLIERDKRRRDYDMMRDSRRMDSKMGTYEVYGQYDSRGSDYRGSDYRSGDYTTMGHDMRRNDYRGSDYDMRRNDYASYDYYGGSDKEYEEDLKKWIDKLKRKDKFNLSFDQVLQHAKNHGVKFNEYNEKEFYATYLMLQSDFKNMLGSNDPMTYIKMAKDFLEDDDIEVSPSEKLCIYMYKIVKGE